MENNRIYYSPQPILHSKTEKLTTANSVSNAQKNQTTFDQVLAQQLSGVQFSQHALQRMESRNITLGKNDLLKLNNAIDKAAQKGAKESLVLMNNNNVALVVSVKNKTVITAMDSINMKENVFTNIDSAVII